MRVEAALNEAQQDALRELTNVGAGHAAAALSQRLFGERLDFQPPEARCLSEAGLAAWLGGEGAARVAAGHPVWGGAQGQLWLVFFPADAASLVDRLERGAPRRDKALAEATREALASALGAMRKLTGLHLQPAALRVWRCSAAELAQTLAHGAEVWVLAARLKSDAFAAELLFVPEAQTLKPLLHALGVG